MNPFLFINLNGVFEKKTFKKNVKKNRRQLKKASRQLKGVIN